MKILFVNDKSGFFGGVEQNLADSAAGLRDRGHECFLAYGLGSGSSINQYRAVFNGSFPCAELRPQPQAKAAQPFKQIVDQVRPQVIYLHRALETGFLEPHLGHIRTVRMVHDHHLCCPRRDRLTSLKSRVCNRKVGWKCWLDLALVNRKRASNPDLSFFSVRRRIQDINRHRRLDLILVGSRFMGRQLLTNGFPQEMIVGLPPLIRLPNSRPSPVPQEKTILYVGELSWAKGVDLLLRALASQPPSVKADIVGTGQAQEQLQALARRLGLVGRVQFHGWLEHHHLERFYAGAKVVVLPSRWSEPFGLAGLEAGACGRPVVAFETGGIPGWLQHGENGLLAPRGDVSELAQALDQVLSDQGLAQELGQRGFDRVCRHYSFDHYLDYLERFLSGSVQPWQAREAAGQSGPG